MSYKIIKTNAGDHIFVSPEDYDYLSKFTWFLRSSKTKGRLVVKWYPVRVTPRPNRKQIIISREIMNCPKSMVVDHINGNTLDNRRSNLRIVTQSENSMNMTKSKSSRMTSKYKGVSWSIKEKRWIAKIKKMRKSKYLGSYKCEKNAAKAYNKSAIEMFGQYAKLNQI